MIASSSCSTRIVATDSRVFNGPAGVSTMVPSTMVPSTVFDLTGRRGGVRDMEVMP